MIKLALGLFVFLYLLLVSSCTKDKAPLFVPAPLTFCDPANITYTLHAKPIIESHCSIGGCHDAFGSAPGNYSLYIDVKSDIDNGTFQNRTFVKKDMPLTYSLPDSLITVLQCWIDKGALNN